MTTNAIYSRSLLVNRMDTVTRELERLQSLPQMSRTQEAAHETLYMELVGENGLQERLKRADTAERADILEGALSGRYRTESGTSLNGDPDAPSGSGDHAVALYPVGGPSGAVRDHARRTLDGLRSLPDHSRERLTRTFERAEAEPDGRELDVLSQWLLATSSPSYARAVGKLFRDPENGH